MTESSIWTRREAPAATGRPVEHGRPQIVTAGIAVAEAEGLTAVTMRRVAAELGTGPASLYRHLATRDDLIDLMVDQALEGWKSATIIGSGRSDLVADELTYLAFLQARPWLTDALWIRPPTAHVGPNSVRRVEGLLGRLADDPAPGWAKLEAIGMLDGMVRNHAHDERRGASLEAEHLAAIAAQMIWLDAAGPHPHLVAALAAPPPPRAEPAEQRLARLLLLALDLILDRAS
jgi:AcrR family transcriptional regulator